MFQLKPNQDISGINLNDSHFLNKEEYTAINTAVIGVAEQEFTLLNLFPIETVESSKSHYEYTTLTETGEAGIVEVPSDFPALKLDGSLATVRIPMKGISFRLLKDDIANSRKLGQKLDARYARTAGKLVSKLQDEALYSKSSSFGTLGVEGQATGVFGGSDWSTGTTDVYDQVRLWIKAIPAAYTQESMRMILHRDQWSELFRGNWNNGTNNEQVSAGTFFKKIMENYPGLVIVQSQWVTATEGILFPFNEDVVRRIVAISTRAVDFDENFMEFIGAALGKDVLVVPTPSAVVKATGI